ncbi:SURF1 family protein [Naasia lichenicola]|uniref:SURF1-like protein n=1 Tax=Naasia lichenicola TaxID=2565933 RepID=A0A4S4FKF6_9MICO|nr:SURF1 family cytochrome oxidase biogenesis protein [Naasia lichenicola]THG29765.1 hypothetical protein E6C64_13960 [Naasia lichenicola]
MTTPAPSPSMLQIMRRPRSLLMLGGFILLAVVFALFGQWQLSRAVQAGTVVERPTEQVLPLTQVADPATSVGDEAIGQLVSASGEWVRGEFQILADRLDEGRSGYWVTGHFRTDDGDSLAVGLGWTDDEKTAQSALSDADASALPTTVSGRFQQSEAPTEPTDGQVYPEDFAVAALINEWADAGPTYAGYITLTDAPDGLGLDPIYSPLLEQQVQLNFLNLFYAVEWALFAVIALYIWYRLIRDVYERERDDIAGAESAEDGASSASVGQPAARP